MELKRNKLMRILRCVGGLLAAPSGVIVILHQPTQWFNWFVGGLVAVTGIMTLVEEILGETIE